jgi:tetratricopeptide (TPR) repeat protein
MNEREKGGAEWYRKGTEAMQHKNWNYAVECFTNCTRLVPDNVLYRQSRVGCIRKSYGDNGSGAKMASMRLMGVRTRIKKSRLSKDWKSIEQAAEEGLLVNPWDAQLFFDLGEALVGQENLGVARFALEKAVELDRDNVDYNRTLGAFLFERRDYKPARQCYERIYKLVPTDSESRAMLGRIDAVSMLDRGKLEEAESTRDVKVEPTQPANAYEEDRRARKGQPKAADAPGESAEADLIHAIRKDPANVGLYLKLADLYKAARDFGKAQDQLTKALELSPNNGEIRELILDVQLSRLREEASEAETRARANPGKERLVEKARGLQQDVVQKELEFFTLGVELNPTDLKKKFELAQRLASRHVKQFSKAIPLLQQAASNPSLKTDALVLLGECFARDGKSDLARRQLEKAIEGLAFADRPDSFRTAHYLLGRLYQAAGKNEQAEHHYGEVLAVDYEYKDVLKRMEELAGSGGSALDE